MQQLILNKFKSYDQLSLSNLNSRLNVVLGHNGQGKSNLLKAISFLFTDKYTLNKAEYGSTLNRAFSREEDRTLSVEAVFKPSTGQDVYHISRSWVDPTKQVFRVSGKQTNEKQFATFVKSFGLSRSNSFNIFYQGKISHIASMSQMELYGLLEENSSAQKVAKHESEIMKNMEKVGQNTKEVVEILNQLGTKMKDVESKRTYFEQFSMEQKVLKYRKRIHYSKQLEETKSNLTNLKQEYDRILKQMREIQAKNRQFEWDSTEIENNLRITNRELLDLTSLLSNPESGQSYIQLEDMHKKNLQQQSQLNAELTNKQKQIKKLEKAQNQVGKQLEFNREKFQKIKDSYSIGSHGGANDRAEKCYNAKIQAELETLSVYKEQLKDIEMLLEDLGSKGQGISAQEFNKLQKEKSRQLERLNIIKRKVIQARTKKISFQGNSLRHQEKKSQLEMLMRKIMPSIDLNLIKLAQQSGISGVHGYFLSHLEIEPQLQFAYEKAALNKLCSIIVEDQDTAIQIIKLNSKNRGRTISVIPLSIIEQEPRSGIVNNVSEVHSLVNSEWIKLKDESPTKMSAQSKKKMQKLIESSFGKCVLVSDYPTALKVSKEYHVNCITSDGQVIYADACICKVGGSAHFQKGKLEIFESYQKSAQELAKSGQVLDKQDKQILDLQNQLTNQSNIFQKVSKLYERACQRQQEHRKMSGLSEKLRIKRQQLKSQQQKSQNNMKYLNGVLNNAKKGKANEKYSKADLDKAEAQYMRYQEQFDRSESHYHKVLKQIQELQTRLVDRDRHNKQGRMETDNRGNQALLNDIQNKIKEMQEKYEEVQALNADSLGQLVKVKQEQAHLLAELTVEQDKESDLAENIEKCQAQEGSAEDREELEEMSHSMSLRQPAQSRNRQIFTSRDKVFFLKIEDYFKRRQQLESSSEHLKSIMAKMERLIVELREEKGKTMKKLIREFQSVFEDYFRRIVSSGKAQVSVRNSSVKIKGVSKTIHSLRVKVSFSGQETQDWKNFSLGQRSVLAICIVMAIQKCEPTPFCIMDEADAALDSNYAKKLIHLILEESENCQYWLSSFKEQTIGQIPETLANFYLVRNQNQKSSASEISKAEAQSFALSHSTV